ncbi:hypothetical protein GCM10009555_096000 [Acrocarpospora macrocephala]|uniref:Uncharacterized protein n=1 Tax=Acrocarpospora macrocephala TaxID=150177 RepID=A0A5M3WJR9_9ACTN|nr:hypothetical protein [Acrocarpospora macrocephala]GES09455.1 hypothetical protein Amac_030510 [Acrocarpospora macrocephala]
MTVSSETADEDDDRVVVFDRGARRVLVMDSVSYASAEDAGQTIVTGSHGGTSAGEYARRRGVACVVCNDAGFGKNRSGVAGLRDLDRNGIAGIAVGHQTARIGDGLDAWEAGVVSYVNDTARRAGFTAGRRLQDQLRSFLTGDHGFPPWTVRRPGGRAGLRRNASRDGERPGEQVFREVVLEHLGRNVVVMDSISFATAADRDHIVVAGSNGGRTAGEAGLRHGCHCVVLNDAGIGKDGSGIAGIRALDAGAVAGIAVSHDSAEISNGMDTWENGIISYVNETAAAAEFAVGQRVRDAIARHLASGAAR